MVVGRRLLLPAARLCCEEDEAFKCMGVSVGVVVVPLLLPLDVLSLVSRDNWADVSCNTCSQSCMEHGEVGWLVGWCLGRLDWVNVNDIIIIIIIIIIISLPAMP